MVPDGGPLQRPVFRPLRPVRAAIQRTMTRSVPCRRQCRPMTRILAGYFALSPRKRSLNVEAIPGRYSPSTTSRRKRGAY
jgi:hypothetical protein